MLQTLKHKVSDDDDDDDDDILYVPISRSVNELSGEGNHQSSLVPWIPVLLSHPTWTQPLSDTIDRSISKNAMKRIWPVDKYEISGL